MASILDSLITGITIDSAWGPSIPLDHPFAPSDTPNPFLEALKPKITIALSQGQPVVIAPYGDPGDTLWPWIELAALIGATGIGVWVLSRFLK